MSDKNPEAKRAARDRLIKEREQQKAGERRRRQLIVAGAVVGVLALAAVVGVIAANAGGGDSAKDSGAGGPAVAPAGADGKDTLAIPAGAADAPSTLTVWEDFRCPACAAFENGFRSTIHELEKSGQIRVEYHLATLIDDKTRGGGSLHAANAAGCAQDAGKFTAYHDVLYTNQPDEMDDAYADNNKLLDLAKKVPGLDTPAFRSCVENGTHNSWVVKSNEAFQAGHFNGTPTVQLNGVSVFPMKGSEQITPANLKKWVAQANKGKATGTASPKAAGKATPKAAPKAAGKATPKAPAPAS